MKLRIEKNVPLPRPHLLKGHRDLMRRMVPGDSLWLPINQRGASRTASEIFGTGNFRTRKEVKHGIDGVRLWRVKK